MATMRAGVYARFSSDLQRITSIEDQIGVARTFADSQGWTIADDQIYTDAALSGVSLERAGIQAVLAAAERRPASFEVLLVDDSSRVSRDLPDAVRFMQQLRFLGVRVVYISQNIDSASEQAETLVAVHGVVDSLFLRELGTKTKRGLAGQLARGFATGGKTYGYRTVPVPDPSGKTDVNGFPVLSGKRVEVIPEQARVIVQIFEWYASGLGTGRLVERLNREGLCGPRGERWKEGAVKRVLANEKYRGRLIWGRRTAHRRPGTRQLVIRPVPREQWRVNDRPELRIVSEDLWQRALARRQTVHAALPASTGRTLMRGRDAALHSHHLFSGFMRCGVCDGAISVASGGNGSPRYGCIRSWRNGIDTCSNRVTMRARVADAHLLVRLKAELISPAALRYITDAVSTALNRRLDERPRLLAEAHNALELARQRLRRLVEAVENGVPPTSLAAAFAEREADVARAEATIAEMAEPVRQRLAVTPVWVREQLDNLVELLGQAPERVKTEFRRLELRVTVTPVIRDDGRSFFRANAEGALPFLTGITDMRDGSVSAVDRSRLR